MPTFIAVYRGNTVSDARLVGVTADPALVSDVVTRMLDESQDCDLDPVVHAIAHGRVTALRLIKREAGHATE